MKARLPLFLAWRMLRGLRGGAAPLLAKISIGALAVGAAAMIILFSVFNGFDETIKDLYKAFYPDIRISVARGKFFQPDARMQQVIGAQQGIAAIAPVLEDHVLAGNGAEQVVATVKGVNNAYFAVNNLKPYVRDGADSFAGMNKQEAIMGILLAGQLGTPPDNAFSRVILQYPNTKERISMLNPQDAFQTLELAPAGVFQVQQEFDEQYILAPLPMVQDLFREPNRLSSLEIRLADPSKADAVKQSLQSALGAAYRVETRFEQNRTLFSVIKTEKWAIYAILLFVLLIASVNMIGALSLLALEKEKDAAILKAMGGKPALLRRTFLAEGLLWGALGGGGGLLLGGLICWGQKQYGWLKLQGFVINQYPVAMRATDFLVVLATVIGVGLLAAVAPARRLAGRGLSGGWNVR